MNTSYKKFTVTVIASCIALLLLSCAIIYIIDPFMRFHAPIGNLAAAETNEYYANIGAARNLDYQSAIVGSSMSENFSASWFTKGFEGNCVKFSFQGAHFNDYKHIFDEISKKGTAKNIFFSMDNYMLIDDPNSHPTSIPEYIRNTDFNSHLKYFFNRGVLFDYLPRFIINNIRTGFSADSAYEWASKSTFARVITLSSYKVQRNPMVYEMWPYEYFVNNCNDFLDGIRPYIEGNPDTTFYMYSPPYSILYWDDSIRNGYLNAEISAQAYVIEELLRYDNVRYFYFQNDMDIITNLNNYKDYSHYSPDINYHIYESMRDGKNELTLSDVTDTLMETHKNVQNYDYNLLFFGVSP